MTASTDRLIHLVLDGEATPDERRTLERLVAADPEVAERQADARRLLAALDGLPQKHPPEGLVAAVMAKIPQDPLSGPGRDQLPTASRVFGATMTGTGDESPRTADHRRIHVPAATRGSFGMSEQSNGSGKRTLIIGAGVLAVAVAAAIGTGVLPVGQNTSGTIVPAQRFIAPQNTAVGVQQDARPRTTEPLPPAAGAAAGAAEAGARGAAEAGARGAAEAGARGAAEAGARGAAEAGARGAAEAGARGAAEAGARGAAEAGARGAAEAGARGAAEAGARGAAEAGARGAAEAGAKGSAQAGARGAAEAGARGSAEAGARGAAEAGARGAAEAGARGAAEAGARGAAEAGAKGAAEAGARGAAEAGARGAAEAGAKGSAQAGAK